MQTCIKHPAETFEIIRLSRIKKRCAESYHYITSKELDKSVPIIEATVYKSLEKGFGDYNT